MQICKPDCIYTCQCYQDNVNARLSCASHAVTTRLSYASRDVTKMELSQSYLNTGIADVADLLAIELLPFLAVKFLDERNDVRWPHHVDESIAYIALVLEVNGQVEEVVGAAELLINGGQEHLLGVLVGDVLDH